MKNKKTNKKRKNGPIEDVFIKYYLSVLKQQKHYWL
jgi:hypothetical protein